MPTPADNAAEIHRKNQFIAIHQITHMWYLQDPFNLRASHKPQNRQKAVKTILLIKNSLLKKLNYQNQISCEKMGKRERELSWGEWERGIRISDHGNDAFMPWENMLIIHEFILLTCTRAAEICSHCEFLSTCESARLTLCLALNLNVYCWLITFMFGAKKQHDKVIPIHNRNMPIKIPHLPLVVDISMQETHALSTQLLIFHDGRKLYYAPAK